MTYRIKKLFLFFICFIILVVSSLEASVQSRAQDSIDESHTAVIAEEVYQAPIETIIQVAAPQKMSSLFTADLEATMTLAELQEILIKIDEDLTERINGLEYGDTLEVITRLKAKKKMVISYLKELQGFDEDTVALYLLMSQHKKDQTFFWIVVGTCVLLATTVGFMASYDMQTGRNWPSMERLKSNFHNMVEYIATWILPAEEVPPPAPIAPVAQQIPRVPQQLPLLQPQSVEPISLPPPVQVGVNINQQPPQPVEQPKDVVHVVDNEVAPIQQQVPLLQPQPLLLLAQEAPAKPPEARVRRERQIRLVRVHEPQGEPIPPQVVEQMPPIQQEQILPHSNDSQQSLVPAEVVLPQEVVPIPEVAVVPEIVRPAQIVQPQELGRLQRLGNWIGSKLPW